jgi:hypothetical protein
LLLSLATRVQVPADQLVLVHEGQRIFSAEKTPKQLGISFTGELSELDNVDKAQLTRRGLRAPHLREDTEGGQPRAPRLIRQQPSPH